MEKFTVDGIVIKTSVTGESDLVLWVLTRNRGVIRAFAKGARGTKSRLHGGASLFSYCSFSFSENKGVYHISECAVKNVFFELRHDIKFLTLAQYFCEVLLKIVPEKCEEEIYLRLILNSLYLLSKGEKNPLLIKAVFELRLASVSGYMPNIIACDTCGEFITEQMYFDCATGTLYCKKCGNHMLFPEISSAVISAMRHICFSEFEKIFSFELNSDLLPFLCKITEIYLKSSFGQDFKLLEYFKNLL